MSKTKFYIIKPAVDTPETGNVYPAVETYDDYDFNASNSIHKLNFREFPDFEPDIRFKLKNGAKLTDMLSQAAINAHGFIISDKLKVIFEKLSIVPHKYYPAYIEDKQGKINNYFWLHLVWKERFNFINFNQSKFYKIENEQKIQLTITNATEFKQTRKKLGLFNPINTEKLVTNSTNFNMLISPFKTDILITENKKKEFESTLISGIAFELWNQ